MLERLVSVRALLVYPVASLVPSDWEVTPVDMNVEKLSAAAVAAADFVHDQKTPG